MILSVLIPAKKENKKYLDQLLSILLPQIKELEDKIEVYIESGEKMQIGEKMNSLLKDASGEYVWFIEDTQLISETAISDIFNAIESEPDIVNICGGTSLNGNTPYDWSQGVGLDVRPDHNNPMKLSIAKSIKFRKKKVDALQIWKKEVNDKCRFSTFNEITKPILHKRIILTKA